MGKFYEIKVWLEDRELEILKSYNFGEEVWESDIPEDKRWILTDLCIKGFLFKVYFEHKSEHYYIGTAGYSQHFSFIEKLTKQR